MNEKNISIWFMIGIICGIVIFSISKATDRSIPTIENNGGEISKVRETTKDNKGEESNITKTKKTSIKRNRKISFRSTVICGHGKSTKGNWKDPGAYIGGGIWERQAVKEIVGKNIIGNNIGCNKDLNLYEKLELINKIGGSFIEVHFDKRPVGSFKGIKVLYKDNKQLAISVCKKLNKIMECRIKYRNNLYLLNNYNDIVIVELPILFAKN